MNAGDLRQVRRLIRRIVYLEALEARQRGRLSTADYIELKNLRHVWYAEEFKAGEAR